MAAAPQQPTPTPEPGSVDQMPLQFLGRQIRTLGYEQQWHALCTIVSMLAKHVAPADFRAIVEKAVAECVRRAAQQQGKRRAA